MRPIDADAAIAAAIEAVDKLDGGYNLTRAEAITNEINRVPTADIASERYGYWIGWNPVTEVMPPADEIVLVTCQPKKGPANVNRAYWADGSWHGSGSMSTVTAWMKLPEPYTEASDAEVH